MFTFDGWDKMSKDTVKLLDGTLKGTDGSSKRLFEHPVIDPEYIQQHESSGNSPYMYMF